MATAILRSCTPIVSHLLSRGVTPTADDVVAAVKQKKIPILDAFFENDTNQINKEISNNVPPFLAQVPYIAPVSEGHLHGSGNLFSTQNLPFWFLHKGADPNARCRYDITPLSIAARASNSEIVDLLFKHEASVPFGQLQHHPARGEHADLVILETILTQGVNLNEIMFERDPISYQQFRDFNLGSVLHQAAASGNGVLMNFLLRKAADITLGVSPFHWFRIDSFR